MVTTQLEQLLKHYPELRLQPDHHSQHYLFHGEKQTVYATPKEVKRYIGIYEYCKSLIKRDQLDLAIHIAFEHNDNHNLPYDRLPFLALLHDPSHLVETINHQPKLEIVPQVKGKQISFFYEEGDMHQPVNCGFVGKHLRANSLCENDVDHHKFDKAMLRAIKMPLSSRLIDTYDAHIQCNHLVKAFDFQTAQKVNAHFDLGRNIRQEYIDYIMPLALKFRGIYQHQSLEAAKRFAHQQGFTPVIRDHKLVTLRSARAEPTQLLFQKAANDLADLPVVNYESVDTEVGSILPNLH